MYKDEIIAPKGAKAYNPSFDITSGEIITGIINENGIVHRNYRIKGYCSWLT